MGFFDENAKKILVESKIEALKLKEYEVRTDHLLLSILNNNNLISYILKKHKVNYTNVLKNIEIDKKVINSSKYIFSPLLKKIIINSVMIIKNKSKKELITIDDLFLELIDECEGNALNILYKLNVDIDLIYDEIISLQKTNKKDKNEILMIEKIGNDLTKMAQEHKLDPVINREKEINRIIEILNRKSKNNPLLVGLAGVGKTAIVEELANFFIKKNYSINNKPARIISLNMSSIISGTKYRGEFEEKVNKVIDELENNPHIIVFIDEIHTLVGAGGAEGAIDAANIFKPALARGKIKVIGATTIKEYKKSIEKDSALDRRFQKILINEPTLSETKEILFKLRPVYEEFHNVIVSDDVLEKILLLSDKYINNKNRPDKCIDILDEVCSRVEMLPNNAEDKINNLKHEIKIINNMKINNLKKCDIKQAYNYLKKEDYIKRNIIKYIKSIPKNCVTLNDVAKIITNKTNIPIYEIMKEKAEIFDEIENKFKKELLGHNNIINLFLNKIKKIKLGYSNNKVNSMIFIGPSGVGKTLAAKLFAKYLVGENNFLRLDMSEYSDISSINKLLGSNAGYVGYDDNNNLFELIKDKSNAVILFDEIEKAHSSIINLFYQILDYGKIRDNKGNIINFNNNIIIFTSNIGYEKNKMGFDNEVNNYNSLSDFFPKAFINRIDDIIKFEPLNLNIIKTIVSNEINNLINKYGSKIKISYDNNLIEDIVKLSDYKLYGARKIEKIVNKYIESEIIDNIIKENKKIKIGTLGVLIN